MINWGISGIRRVEGREAGGAQDSEAQMIFMTSGLVGLKDGSGRNP